MSNRSIIPRGFDRVGEATYEMSPIEGKGISSDVSLRVFFDPDGLLGNTILQFDVSPVVDDRRKEIIASYGLDQQRIPWFDGLTWGVIRYNLLNSMLVVPLEPGAPSASSPDPHTRIAEHLGIRSERGIDGDGKDFLDVRCTLGAKALSELYDSVRGLGDSVKFTDYHSNTNPGNNMSYEGEQLIEGLKDGTVLVAPVPEEGVSVTNIAWSAIHDNILHLYGNILLRTPAFNELVRTFGPRKDVSYIDSELAYVAGTITELIDYGWYEPIRPGENYVPYTKLHELLIPFIDDSNPMVARLINEARLLRKIKDRTQEPTDAEWDEYVQLVLSPDSVLEQLDDAANSIPRRFVSVTGKELRKERLDMLSVISALGATAGNNNRYGGGLN